MVERAQASIRIRTNERPAIQGLQNLTREWATMTTGLNQGLELLDRAFGRVGQAYRFFADNAAEAIELANVQDEAERRLATALRLSGDATTDTLERMQAFASQLQQVTVVGDEVTLSLQSQLLAMGVTVDQLEDATRASIGLSRAMGVDLRSAGRVVVRTLQGQTGALREYGISVETTAEGMERLNELFAIAEAEAETFGGRTQQLQNAWGDFNEELGRGITQSEAANAIVKTLTDTVTEFTGFLASDDGQQTVDDFFQAVAAGAAASLGFVQTLRDVIAEVRFRVGLDDFIAEGLGEDTPAAAIRRLEVLLREIGLGRRREAAGTGGPAPGGGGARDRGAGGGAGGARRRGGGTRDSLDAPLQALGLLDRPTFAETEDERAAFFELETQRREEFTDGWQRSLSILGDAFSESAAITQAQSAAMTQAVASFAGNAIANFAATAASGEDFGRSFQRFIGQTIAGLGTQLIQLGTAAVAAGTLGTVVPLFAGVTGGPAGAAAGAAAIAAGATMVGVGTALGATAGPGASAGATSVPTVSAAPRSGTTTRAPDLSQQPASPFQLGGQAITIVQNFNSPVIGNDRRGARALAGILGARATPVGVGG